MINNRNGKNFKMPGLENNNTLTARFAQIYMSDFDMKEPMFICHIGNRHHRFNLFVHGVAYFENEEGEKERGLIMIMLEHLERGKKVDMVVAFPNINNMKKHPFRYDYTVKSDLDFKPEFFMTSKEMDWELLTKKLGETIDNKKIIKYIVGD